MKSKDKSIDDKTIKIPREIYGMIIRIKERTDLPIKHIVKRAIELWAKENSK